MPHSINEAVQKSHSQHIAAMQEIRDQTWLNFCATLPAAILSTPFDFLKTRVMTQSLAGPDMSALEHLKKMHSEESLFRLFRGAGLRAAYVSVVMTTCTTFTMFLMEPIERTQEIERRLAQENRRDTFSK